MDDGPPGPGEQLLTALQNFEQACITLDYRLERELGASGLNTLLNADRIESDPELRESRVVLKHLDAVLERNRQKYIAIINTFNTEVARIIGDESDPFLTKMKERQKSQLQVAKEQWTLVDQNLADFDKTLEFLHANRSSWIAEQQLFRFKNASTYSQFEQLNNRLKAYKSKYDELRRKFLMQSRTTE